MDSNNDTLMQRQQTEIINLMHERDRYRLLWINAEHKAYKKFAVLLKEQAKKLPEYYDKIVWVENIENLLEELIGENND